MEKKMFKQWKRAVEKVAENHPVTEAFNEAMTGSKGWKDLLRAIKPEDYDAIHVAIHNIKKALEKRHERAGERDFWVLADRVATFAPSDAFTSKLLVELHENAVDYALNVRRDVIRHPEFWNYLITTLKMEHMDKDDLQRILDKTFALIDEALVGKEVPLKHPLHLAETIMDTSTLIEKSTENMKGSEKEIHWNIQTRAAIRAKTARILLARRAEKSK